MSKEYFTSVDFDSVFPKPVEVPPSVPGLSPEAKQAKAEAIHEVVRKINNELVKVRTGQSEFVPTAQQFVESKTPFCINLLRLPDDLSKVNPVTCLTLTALARQDFGERFATFVLELFKPIFEEKQ